MRVTLDGKLVDESLIEIYDKQAKVFSSEIPRLVIDFGKESGWSFTLSQDCFIIAGNNNTFLVGSGCEFDVGSGCTICSPEMITSNEES